MERKTETRSKHSVNHLLSFTETTLRHQFQASSSFATTSDFMTAVVRNFFYRRTRTCAGAEELSCPHTQIAKLLAT